MNRTTVSATSEVTAVGEGVEVRECPHGPVLVRGAAFVEHDGRRHDVEHPVVAVCRCGKSRSLPWCDSTHRAIPGY